MIGAGVLGFNELFECTLCVPGADTGFLTGGVRVTVKY